MMSLVKNVYHGLVLFIGVTETLYKGDDALSTKPVMHYQCTAYLCY